MLCSDEKNRSSNVAQKFAYIGLNKLHERVLNRMFLNFTLLSEKCVLYALSNYTARVYFRAQPK